MKNLRELLVCCAIIVVAVTLFVFAMPTAHADDISATYKAKCSMCHAMDGSPTAAGKVMGALDLKSDDVQKKSDAELSGFIENGSPNKKMKAYGSELKPDQIKALVAFIRGLKK